MTERRWKSWLFGLCVVLGASGAARADVVTTPLQTFSGHTGDVLSVAFSPDGTKVLTGSPDGTARLWGTTVPVPAVPANLIATAASSSQINLSWHDNSNDEVGFRIERKTGAGGSWSQIAISAANVTTYDDKGLSPTATYYYRARAYNAWGYSDWSNEASATTAPAQAERWQFYR